MFASASENVSPNSAGALHMGFGGKPPSSEETGGLEFIYLKKYFGHDRFRPRQQEVVQAAVQGRDCAVFWATGAGKSLCYQLPALQTGKTVIVVSPLVSLMQDQVVKFNATIGAAGDGHRACFLGSSQFDPQVQKDALQGKYRLVYVTPEKISSGFLGSLKSMHAAKQLALLAVDEAHCISEWGHDFRPSYRQLRSIRQELPGLPIMSLTATAVPRVRDDIIEQLDLQPDKLLSCSSFDRDNLALSCSRKTSKAKDLDRIAKEIAKDGGATIVYAPTQAEVDSLASFFSERLSATGVAVAAYHGGLAPGEREDAHLGFLSGKMKVIVATVAFGMGIDKSDIRRIVHYGPPKTVEEYFQQVGRAGRDGLNSSCELICSDSDFGNYSSDFYTKGLTEQAKEQMLSSCAALRRFAGEGKCRRAWLLKYFGETPAFGDRCGTCDVCVAAKTHADDTHRDFRQAAAPILEAVAATSSFPQPMTQLLPIINGNYKPKSGGSLIIPVREATPRILAMRDALPKMMRQEAFTKEMIGMLVNSGHLLRKRIQLQRDGFGNSFDVYEITPLGESSRHGKCEIRLPVPVAIRQQEEEERRKTEARAAEIEKAGFDIKRIPKKQLEDENDPLLWYIRKIQYLRNSGKDHLIKQADNHEELRKRVIAWRDAAAQRLRMAPADVIPEHVTASIAYSKPTTVDALRAAGVRIVGAEELAALVATAKEELFPANMEEPGGTTDAGEAEAGGTKRAASMKLPEGLWTPKKWAGAVYKPGKAGAKPPWEVSYDRFVKGEGIQTIAIQQAKGKPIQATTVAGHLLTAIQQGKPLDLCRMVAECGTDSPLPDEAAWNKMEQSVAESGIDVQSADFKAKDLLRAILGESVDKDFATKSDADKSQEATWYGRIRWFEAFKRGGLVPTFGEDEPAAKRQRQD
eukprot:TRINITY_DN27305_c0_g2_i1.p1 TRINITY_DN27305_c0_g2~~TRINITY_DN27305_c0_g2_i1.p1  ORF type:complete len:919 (+),score=196.92 TRINITY_DN27305_c0_g2_i1:49-2805(+)